MRNFGSLRTATGRLSADPRPQCAAGLSDRTAKRRRAAFVAGWLVASAPVIFAGSGCAEELPDHVELRPAGIEVDIAVDVPTPDAYKLVGQVTGMAAAHDVEVAHDAARNDLRNKAAALGATLVTIDEDTGEAVLLLDKTRVKVVGRAYKPID